MEKNANRFNGFNLLLKAAKCTIDLDQFLIEILQLGSEEQQTSTRRRNELSERDNKNRTEDPLGRLLKFHLFDSKSC
jgi:hypothetical protein